MRPRASRSRWRVACRPTPLPAGWKLQRSQGALDRRHSGVFAFGVRVARPLSQGALHSYIPSMRAVVHSLIRFSKAFGNRLVKTEEEASQYWLRATRACVAAQRAFGSEVVRPVRYSEVVAAPRPRFGPVGTVRETYSARCLKPLKEKIDGSNVRSEFDQTDERTNPGCTSRRMDFSKRSRRKTCPYPLVGSVDAARDPIRGEDHLWLGQSTKWRDGSKSSSDDSGTQPGSVPDLQRPRRGMIGRPAMIVAVDRSTRSWPSRVPCFETLALSGPDRGRFVGCVDRFALALRGRRAGATKMSVVLGHAAVDGIVRLRRAQPPKSFGERQAQLD